MSSSETIQEFVVSIPNSEEVSLVPERVTDTITTGDNRAVVLTIPQDDPAWREQALLGILDRPASRWDLPDEWEWAEVDGLWAARYVTNGLTWGTVQYDPTNESVTTMTHNPVDIVVTPVEVVLLVLRRNGVDLEGS